ncbi:sister chromatid cohesion protein PDS5 homolog D-like [Quercus robur]|uniref:sister chromatid cohesion protein PDS5 homolog D-like n=1 Tax=Quercus robur TaxID=38942 RepID=UPI00216214FE|nr:sister chromatid cohesion protein PDS5 homolog D-like [Quercus robur]
MTSFDRKLEKQLKDREFERQIKEAGNRLINPPSSIDDLLTLLDKVENLLAYVEQEPSKSMRDALLPSVKALITDKLLRHAEMDVKVSVVSCIIEITRITAPDAPYKDEQMKEIFQFIVAAFENMPHVSTRSYKKVVSILDTIAKVKLCFVMLDLECDALVVEMFQSFLKIIRSNYPPFVLSAMETIMNLVIDESEDISLDLLSSLFAIVRKENQNVSPISWTLGEQIITRINAQLERIMAPTQKLPNELESAHDVNVEVVKRASDQPSTILEDLHLGKVEEVKTTMFPMVHKVQDEIMLIPHIDFVIPNESNAVEFKVLLV